MKGLEAPEMVSLLWPKALKERIKVGGDKAAKVETEVFEPSTQLLDVNVIKQLGRVCHRLESAAAALVHPAVEEVDPAAAAGTVALASKRKALLLPTTNLAFPVRQDADDAELAVLLECYLIRIENVLSTLVLHQLGPFTEVLAALGGALKTDPRYVMMALSKFAMLTK